MKKTNNKGFSLIELIIVIAIMSILVGIFVPCLVIYLGRTKVSSDTQTCDAIHSAILIAMNDPDVLCATDASVSQVDNIKSGNAVNLDNLTDSVFLDTLNEIVGYDVSSQANNRQHFSSKAAKQNGELVVQFYDSSYYIWINGSDVTGSDNSYTVADASAINNNVIYVK